MPVSISDPKLTVKVRVETDWNPANVSSITPDFHTGFLNPGGAQYQICFPNVNESVLSPSGYTGIAADGPVSRRLGVVPCMIFGRRAAKGSAGALNPKLFLYQARMEVERIIHAAHLTEADFEYLSVINSSEQVPDTEHEPPFFGWTVMIQYEWRKTLS